MKRSIFIAAIILGAFLFEANHANAQVVVTIKPVRPKVVAVKPRRPSVRHVWIEGHWAWNRRAKAYTWKKGYWARAKRGKNHVAGTWVKTRGGWLYKPGRWVRG